jgi:hypothetical protein
VLTPSADAFTVRWPGDRFRGEPLRAWLRRPDALRVESVDGALRQIVRETRTTVAVLSFPPTGETHWTYPWPADTEAPRPAIRTDGLVGARPRHLSYDVPGLLLGGDARSRRVRRRP